MKPQQLLQIVIKSSLERHLPFFNFEPFQVFFYMSTDLKKSNTFIDFKKCLFSLFWLPRLFLRKIAFYGAFFAIFFYLLATVYAALCIYFLLLCMSVDVFAILAIRGGNIKKFNREGSSSPSIYTLSMVNEPIGENHDPSDIRNRGL